MPYGPSHEMTKNILKINLTKRAVHRLRYTHMPEQTHRVVDEVPTLWPAGRIRHDGTTLIRTPRFHTSNSRFWCGPQIWVFLTLAPLCSSQQISRVPSFCSSPHIANTSMAPNLNPSNSMFIVAHSLDILLMHQVARDFLSSFRKSSSLAGRQSWAFHPGRAMTQPRD